jgi:imidazoleglycerol-phosphate dehydratase / histidinol-phosphatase
VKKVIFLDRDGTLIKEPPDTLQVDTLDQLEFLPGVFKALATLSKKTDFIFVIVSNQDGLGTDSYPEQNYNRVQEKLITYFKNEGVNFEDVLIDRSWPQDKLPTRKPSTGLLAKYMDGKYDISNSWVIGDRLTDIELARNIGAKGILLGTKNQQQSISESNLDNACKHIAENWEQILHFLLLQERSASYVRNTKETQISVEINLDGEGNNEIHTGLGFFDHMLAQIAQHGGIDISINAKGDLHIDEHHTIEDVAITLGEAFYKALGSKQGMERYGFSLPMDDCEASVLIDFGGRPWLVWDVKFNREKIGDFPTEMFYHFFKSFSDHCKCNLNIKASGENEHHKIEAVFKAFARSLRMAIRRDPFSSSLPTTKGVL